jgi:hypothetical protein
MYEVRTSSFSHLTNGTTTNTCPLRLNSISKADFIIVVLIDPTWTFTSKRPYECMHTWFKIFDIFVCMYCMYLFIYVKSKLNLFCVY